MYDEMAACQGVVLDERTRTVWHSTAVRKWKVRIKGKRGEQCGKKGQQVILRIAKGRRYGVISNGSKQHTLAQGRQGALEPRAVFGGAQDRPVQTETREVNRYSVPFKNLLLTVPGHQREDAHQQEENWENNMSSLRLDRASMILLVSLYASFLDRSFAARLAKPFLPLPPCFLLATKICAPLPRDSRSASCASGRPSTNTL